MAAATLILPEAHLGRCSHARSLCQLTRVCWLSAEEPEWLLPPRLRSWIWAHEMNDQFEGQLRRGRLSWLLADGSRPERFSIEMKYHRDSSEKGILWVLHVFPFRVC